MCTPVTIQLINRQRQRLRQRRTHRGERSSPRRPATHPTWCTPSNRKMHSTILQRHHTATRSHPPYRPGARAKTHLSRAGSFKCYEKRDSLPSVNFFFGPLILPMLLTSSYLSLSFYVLNATDKKHRENEYPTLAGRSSSSCYTLIVALSYFVLALKWLVIT